MSCPTKAFVHFWISPVKLCSIAVRNNNCPSTRCSVRSDLFFLKVTITLSPTNFSLLVGTHTLFILGSDVHLSRSIDPQIIKDLDDMREKCRSAVPSADRNSNTEQRIRPKSSLSSSTTRASSASRPAGAASSCRPKSFKGTKTEKKGTEPSTLTKKKLQTNGTKPRRRATVDNRDLDEAEESAIRLVDDEEMEDDGKQIGSERHFGQHVVLLRKWKVRERR